METRQMAGNSAASSLRREKQKLIKCLIGFSPTQTAVGSNRNGDQTAKRKIRTVFKYANVKPVSASRLIRKQGLMTGDQTAVPSAEEDIDDNSVALLCLPDGIQVTSSPVEPRFHSFVITRQNGTRLYGSALIYSQTCPDDGPTADGHHQVTIDDKTKAVVEQYYSHALCSLTTIPFIAAMRSLLLHILEEGCERRVVESVLSLKMPSKGKCLKIKLPRRRNGRKTNRINGNNETRVQINCPQEVYIYRGVSELPLFDYPLRELFTTILKPEQFLIGFTAAMLEYQILVISKDYYKLMLVSEALTSLLLPFKWQHVYVPILPVKLGLHYLDAPTPYIMGINSAAFNSSSSTTSATSVTSATSSLSSLPSTHSIQCRIDCDNNRVECLDSYSPEEIQQPTQSHCPQQSKELCSLWPPFVDDLRDDIESILNSDLRLTTQGLGNQSEALKRVTELARKHKVIDEQFNYLDDLKLNQAVRIAFMRTLRKSILNDYEKFIVNAQSYNRKESVKFDGVSYLCDQPEAMRPFLTKFLETQMFASFIDETAKRIQRSRQQMFSSQHSVLTNYTDQDPDDLTLFNDLLLESRFNSAQEVTLYNDADDCSDGRSLVPPNRKQTMDQKVPSSPGRQRRHLGSGSLQRLKDLSLQPSPVPSDGTTVSPVGDPQSSPVRVHGAALAAQTNWRVVESLLREVKMKTKKILLEKMGNEEIAPLGCGTVGDFEENTLIASLCDLIERIWSHAKANETETVKCAFWSHLIAFGHVESHGENVAHQQIDSGILTPALAWVLLRKRIDSLSQISVDSSSPSSQSTPSSPSKRVNSSSNVLKPIPSTLLYDLKSIQMMTDVKTDIGKSRAFIRLSLERKLLSKHMRTLLSNHDLLISMYKRYSFLRCEEEREQFLTHLLTLNAVDLLCFTNTFTTSVLPYTLFVYGSSPITGWFQLSGSIGQTNELNLANPTNIYSFRHRNLGLLTTLTVSIAQTTKVFIEYCFVRNDVTGHTYKFSCFRWLGRNIDDGATERLLLGEMMVGSSISEIVKKSQQGRSSSIGRHWTRNDVSSTSYNGQTNVEQMDAQDLQQLLGENVNSIVRFYFNNCAAEEDAMSLIKSNDYLNGEEEDGNLDEQQIVDGFKIKLTTATCYSNNNNNNLNNNHQPASQYQRKTPATLNHHSARLSSPRPSLSPRLQHQTQNQLIFGERQFLWTLTQIFHFGFKNRGRSSFRKQVFVWDYILRVQCELKLQRDTNTNRIATGAVTATENAVTLSPMRDTSYGTNKLIDLVDRITNCAANWGKEDKLHLFLLVSLRDHLLAPHFIRILAKPYLAQQYYEPHSFVRDMALITFLVQILATFNDMKLDLQPTLTKGI